MSKTTLALLVLGMLVQLTALILGLSVYPSEYSGPNWPLIAAGGVIGGLMEGLALLSLVSQRQP
jgi:uncharacterized protein involved in exopolysaccharide biosynthesis